MTDQITDQDRRDARQWAERIMEHNTPGSAIGKAAHVILALTDPPEPTLAEEITDWAKVADNEVERTALLDTAGRAGRLETEHAEQALRIDELDQECDRQCLEILDLTSERDTALAEVERLKDAWDELDKQRIDEVERLTAERDREKTISKGWMEAHQKLAEHHAETLECAVQKDAESADLPDPADVKPGEAWLVQVDGKAVAALRIGNGRWVTASGTGFYVWTHGVERLVSSLLPEVTA